MEIEKLTLEDFKTDINLTIRGYTEHDFSERELVKIAIEYLTKWKQWLKDV